MLNCPQEGEKKANYWGSLCMASTVRLGNDANGNAVHVPLRNLLPTVHPNDLVLGGWDICSDNLAAAMKKASVLVRGKPYLSESRLFYLYSSSIFSLPLLLFIHVYTCQRLRLSAGPVLLEHA